MKCEACRAFYHFFATHLINSIIQEHYLLLDSIYHRTLKSLTNYIFGMKKKATYCHLLRNVITLLNVIFVQNFQIAD